MPITNIIHIFTKEEIEVTRSPGWIVSPSDPHLTCILEESQDLEANSLSTPQFLRTSQGYNFDFPLRPH